MRHTATLAAAVAALAIGLLASPAHAATVTLSGGELIRASQPAVYYYGHDGKRYVFPNEKTYATWYSDFSGVVTITDDALGAIPIGGNVTYRPGVKMVKITTDPKVYAVDAYGTLRWVETEAAAVALYGANWNTKIDDVADPFFVNYTVGTSITGASDFTPTAVTASVMTISADKQLTALASTTTTSSNTAAILGDTAASVTRPTTTTTTTTPALSALTPPTLAVSNTGGGAMTGVEQEVLRLTVTNPNSAPVTLKQVYVTIASANYPTLTAARTFTLYNVSGTTSVAGTYTMYPASVAFSPESIPLSLNTPLEIAAGATQSFAVWFNTVDALSATTSATLRLSIPALTVAWTAPTATTTRYDAPPAALTGGTYTFSPSSSTTTTPSSSTTTTTTTTPSSSTTTTSTTPSSSTTTTTTTPSTTTNTSGALAFFTTHALSSFSDTLTTSWNTNTLVGVSNISWNTANYGFFRVIPVPKLLDQLGSTSSKSYAGSYMHGVTASGKLYRIRDATDLPYGSVDELNPSTGAVVRQCGDIRDNFAPLNDNFYYYDFPAKNYWNPTLYVHYGKLYKRSCGGSETLVHEYTYSDFNNDITFSRLLSVGSNLLGIHYGSDGYVIYNVDPASGAATALGSLTPEQVAYVSDFSSGDDALYWHIVEGSSLVIYQFKVGVSAGELFRVAFSGSPTIVSVDASGSEVLLAFKDGSDPHWFLHNQATRTTEELDVDDQLFSSYSGGNSQFLRLP